jgi:hypothetical protein
MTTPRQPKGPDDRERSGWDPRHPDPDEGFSATWGRAPAGGWGDADAGYGDRYRAGYGDDDRDDYRDDHRDDQGDDYRDDRHGSYGRYREDYRDDYPGDYAGSPVEPQDWPRAADEASRRSGPRAAPDDDRYREPSPDRDEPSWGRGPAVTPRRAARRPSRPPWIPLVAAGAVVLVLLVLGFVVPGWFVTRVFDPAAVQTGVTKILTGDYGVDGVADVHCPQGVQVTAGATFTCDASIDGDPVKVPIRVTDGKGGYEVGRPT